MKMKTDRMSSCYAKGHVKTFLGIFQNLFYALDSPPLLMTVVILLSHTTAHCSLVQHKQKKTCFDILLSVILEAFCCFAIGRL